jgi:hypothetical protein
MKRIGTSVAAALIGLAGLSLSAQQRLASPTGTAATEIGGKYNNSAEPEYVGGKWIEISYGRPIKRGRDLWGSGPDYGQMILAGAPVWRAGANVSTRLKTEVPLVINNKSIAPGEYTMFIDLKPGAWTLIVSSWPAQSHHDPSNRQAIWGAFGYTPTRTSYGRP